jgi:hypothetical protein
MAAGLLAAQMAGGLVGKGKLAAIVLTSKFVFPKESTLDII